MSDFAWIPGIYNFMKITLDKTLTFIHFNSRKDLSDVCQKTDSTMDVKVLVQAIQQTMEFEEKLEKRFPTKVSE